MQKSEHVRACPLVLVHIRRLDGPLELAFEIFARQTDRDGLSTRRVNWHARTLQKPTYFLASNHFEPSNRGRRGITRSSARNMAFSFNSSRRASNALNFPLSFSTPTTLDMNLMPCRSRRSLYSRWGSLVIRHTPDVRGSTTGYFRGLRER